MVINSIKITNFRCYYGTSTLSFNANGKITLIYGDSGYGKSSLLQFFRWMFYNDYNFGKNDDKPLFNIAAYKEKEVGDSIEVGGQIDFEHLGLSYRLNKTQIFNVSIQMKNSSLQKSDYKLQVIDEDGGYHPYSGDVANKINSILPKELSQYFLLDGERSRDIVLNSEELRKAIHSLFGLDAYTEALSHIGTNKNSKTTVLGHYASLLAANSTQTINGMSIADMQDTIQELYDVIEKAKAERKEIMAKIEQKNARRDEILKILGAVASKSNIESLIKSNQQIIKSNQQEILSLQHNIGNLFYRTYPYLFLAKITSDSSAVLRKKNIEYASSYQNVFENLKKDLLKEIIQKNICVCGRELDDASRTRINAIIDIMPPGSYVYEFGQFISKAKTRIKAAESDTMKYETYTSRIAQLEEKNSHIEDEIQEKLDELKRLNDAKDLVTELEDIKAEIQQLNNAKAGYEGKIAQKKQINVQEYEALHYVTFTAHKIYGPKGVGCLYVKNDDNGIKQNLTPLLHGGEQECNLRAGTLPNMLIVGFGKACEIAERDFEENHRKSMELEKILINKFKKAFNNKICINNEFSNRVPGILNIRFVGFNNLVLLKTMSPIIAASTGSACAVSKPSRILKAIGLSDDIISESIRISCSPYMNLDDLNEIDKL